MLTYASFWGFEILEVIYEADYLRDPPCCCYLKCMEIILSKCKSQEEICQQYLEFTTSKLKRMF